MARRDSHSLPPPELPVLISYYAGGEEPLLFIDIQEATHMRQLSRTAHALRAGSVEEVDICSLFPVVFEGLSGLWLRREQGSGWMIKEIFRTVLDDSDVVFCWSTTEDGWYQNEGLIGGLLSGPPGHGGHQFFGGPPPDDAEVEISFQEPPRRR